MIEVTSRLLKFITHTVFFKVPIIAEHVSSYEKCYVYELIVIKRWYYFIAYFIYSFIL